jgi:hypothetical protein
MWHNNEVDCSRYQLCVGIVRDPKRGRRYDHVWIEDTKAGLVLNKYKFKKKVDHTSVEDYYRLMHPTYVKKYSGREMIKKVLKTGIYGLLANVPSTVLKASDFKGHKDNRKHPRKSQKT